MGGGSPVLSLPLGVSKCMGWCVLEQEGSTRGSTFMSLAASGAGYFLTVSQFRNDPNPNSVTSLFTGLGIAGISKAMWLRSAPQVDLQSESPVILEEDAFLIP